MSYIDGKSVPKREDRLKNACNVFGGCGSELLHQSGKGCLANKSRRFGQTFNCQLGLALTILATTPDSVLIVHGPVGCGNQNSNTYHRSGLLSRGQKGEPLLWASTSLDETDIINGGEKKLEEAIIKLDAIHRPSVIVVLTTCAPTIIGDDVDEIVACTQKRVGSKIILAHCAGFKTKISATGYDAAYHGFARALDLAFNEYPRLVEDEQREIKERYEKSITVNVFNAFSIGRTDEVELERLLNAIGLKVNFFPNFSHPDSFRKITRASLNVSLCATHDDYFLKYLEERWNMPYIIGNFPIGIQNTGEWLLDIARKFNREEESKGVIKAEVEAIRKVIEKYRAKLKGKRVLITGGEIRVPVTAMLLKELGAEIIGVRGHHYDEFGDPFYAKLVADNPNLEVNIATTQVFELVNMLNRLKPDLVLAHGGSNVWIAKLGIPSIPIYNQAQYYLGYTGVFEVARRAAKVLENISFQKNLNANVSLPYQQEWYSKSPFSYIKEAQESTVKV